MPSISRKPGSHPNAVTRRKHLASCSFHGRKLWLFWLFWRFTRHTARQMFPARWARLHSSAPVYALVAWQGTNWCHSHSIPNGPIAELRSTGMYRDASGIHDNSRAVIIIYIYYIIIDGNSIWLVLFTCEPYIETALLQTPAELGRWVSLLRVTGHAGGAGCSCLRQDANAAVVVVTARAPGRFFEWGLPLWDFLSEVLLSYWAFLSL